MVCSSYPFTVELITQNYFCGVNISYWQALFFVENVIASRNFMALISKSEQLPLRLQEPIPAC